MPVTIYVSSVFRLINCASTQHVYMFYTVLRIKVDHLARGNLMLGVWNTDGDFSFVIGTEILNFF